MAATVSARDFEYVRTVRHNLIRISEPIKESLSKAHINQPEGSNFHLKPVLQSLLPKEDSIGIRENEESLIQKEIRDLCLCLAGLASIESHVGHLMSAIPTSLSVAAKLAFRALSEALYCSFDDGLAGKKDESALVIELMPDVLPLLKGVIKESSIDSEADEFVAASARVPVGSAILAVYQFRWFITKIEYPHLGKLCPLVVPTALTALDHWSPEVKLQATVSFIHLVKNVHTAEFGWYEDVVLDACFRNIPSSDELWPHVVELAVLVLASTQRRNPRSPWFEKILNEMLGHLERQPNNTERRIAWLRLINPVFEAMGLFLLTHFRRLFPLLFMWMHADDDRTVTLVLERVFIILKLTWARKTQYIERLVDELALLFKESAVRKNREAIRAHIFQIFILLHNCMNPQLEVAWSKHKDDANLQGLESSFMKVIAPQGD